MDNYKKASKLKLRFATKRGNLSVEQLWDLSMAELKVLIKDSYKTVKSLGSSEEEALSFLEPSVTENSEVEKINLKFEILKDIYQTKKSELQDAHTAADRKARREKLAEIIEKKEDEKLNSMSVDELKKMYEDLK